MADNTGAPHFIPYVEPTDLVREYPAADEASAFAVAAALDGIPVLAGIGSNVVQAVKTDTFTTGSTTFVDVTGLSVTITPSSVTSKILVLADVKVGNLTDFRRNFVALQRGGAPIYVGDADGNRARISAGAETQVFQLFQLTMMFVDSPATAAAVTYNVALRRDTQSAGTPAVNRRGSDNDDDGAPRTASSITVIEVAE